MAQHGTARHSTAQHGHRTDRPVCKLLEPGRGRVNAYVANRRVAYDTRWCGVVRRHGEKASVHQHGVPAVEGADAHDARPVPPSLTR